MRDGHEITYGSHHFSTISCYRHILSMKQAIRIFEYFFVEKKFGKILLIINTLKIRIFQSLIILVGLTMTSEDIVKQD